MFSINGKSILITGGTGSFGQKFTEIIVKRFPKIKRLVIFSRDEMKQYEMNQRFPESKYPFIRYFIGDVRDQERVNLACRNIDTIIHSAALKQVPTAEYNPMECIKTNILGAQNVINAAINNLSIKQVIALSTDKAAAPINLYGATKLCADKLFVAANNIKGSQDLTFSCVRYGNVIGSRGSVVPFFLKKRKEGVIPVTHPDMTRFNISLEEGVKLVLMALEISWGGEIFVPKIPSYRIMDLAKAIAPLAKIEITGIRPGEKIHEEMITETDALNSVEFGKYYVIMPSLPSWNKDEFIKHFKGKRVKYGFKYNSGNNKKWLNQKKIKEQIKQYVDPDFEV